MSVGMISEQKGNIRKYPFDKTEIEIGNNRSIKSCSYGTGTINTNDYRVY